VAEQLEQQARGLLVAVMVRLFLFLIQLPERRLLETQGLVAEAALHKETAATAVRAWLF
jgi:hypothetical protein